MTDILECVSIDTSLDDELDFLGFALSDPDIRLVLPQANLNGPVYASAQEWPVLREQQEFVYLWNSRCGNPLCWQVRFPFQNLPVLPPIGQQNKHEFLAIHTAFKQILITEQQFATGRFQPALSPVVEISKDAYFGVTAFFSGTLRQDLWLVWDQAQGLWTHERRDLGQMYDIGFDQSHESMKWQEHLLEWVYVHWWNKIDRRSSSSYRYDAMANIPNSWPIRSLRRRCKAYLLRLRITG